MLTEQISFGPAIVLGKLISKYLELLLPQAFDAYAETDPVINEF